MSSTNGIALANDGAGEENLDQMEYHIAELEKCAGAYFRDIQRYMPQGPDFDLQSRFSDWNYAKCAFERITADYSKRLKIRTRQAKIEKQTARKNLWETLHPEYGTHDRDWIRAAPRATYSTPTNFVDETRDEALWYEPSDNFSSPAKLMTERPHLVSTSNFTSKEAAKPPKKAITKHQKPGRVTASKPAPKKNVTMAKTSTTPKTIVTSVASNVKTDVQSKPEGWVPPHLRGPQKNVTTPTPHKKAITSESIQKTVIKPQPKPQPEQSKETPKIPPHLCRSPQPASMEWPHQRQVLITPPATVPSIESSKNPSPVSSNDSSTFNILIDVSDTPATTVFDMSTRNNDTHGTADVWAALMQLK